jgi:hypothetical protein
LRVRFQFQVEPVDIGPVDEALWRDCTMTVQYKDFSAGQRYRLETGSIGFRPWAKLYDAQGGEIARGRERGCAKA